MQLETYRMIILSSEDRLRLEKLVPMCLVPFVDNSPSIDDKGKEGMPVERRIVNRIINDRKVEETYWEDTIRPFLLKVEGIINERIEGLQTEVETVNAYAKTQYGHFMDNYRSQLRNIADIRSIYTTETGEDDDRAPTA